MPDVCADGKNGLQLLRACGDMTTNHKADPVRLVLSGLSGFGAILVPSTGSFGMGRECVCNLLYCLEVM